MNGVIVRCNEEAAARERRQADLKSSVRLLEESFAQERADCIHEFKRATGALKAVKEQLQAGVAQQQTTIDRQIELEDARVRAELERISLEKSHIEREEQALEGDTALTESAISSQTGDLGVKKSSLESSKVAIDEEIRVLEEMLAEKVAARAQLTAELDLVDSKIGEVRKKYERQLNRIFDRKAIVQQSKDECLQEEASVMRDKSQLETQAKEGKASLHSLRDWTSTLEADIFVAETLLSNLSTSSNKAGKDAGGSSLIASISTLESSSDPEVEKLVHTEEALSNRLADQRASVVEQQAQREDLLAESRRIAETIPKLDAEKKQHASSKRFKEAAAVAKDLKDLQTEKESLDITIQTVDASILDTISSVTKTEEQLAACARQLKEAHREQDVVRFDGLTQRAQDVRVMLHVVRKHVTLRAKIKNSSSVSQNPHVVDMCDATLAFLEMELAAVLQEAEGIQQLYGLEMPEVLQQGATWAESEEEEEQEVAVEEELEGEEAEEREEVKEDNEATGDALGVESRKDSATEHQNAENDEDIGSNCSGVADEMEEEEEEGGLSPPPSPSPAQPSPARVDEEEEEEGEGLDDVPFFAKEKEGKEVEARHDSADRSQSLVDEAAAAAAAAKAEAEAAAESRRNLMLQAKVCR
jgi:hypothetical protein